MTLSVGVDLIELNRIRRIVTRYGDRFLTRIYTPDEVALYRDRIPELAVRFAAKEAVSKALGVGVRILARDGIHWKDVEITADERGKPIVRLHGRADERARELGLTEWAVSLSHTEEHAIAFVVAQ